MIKIKQPSFHLRQPYLSHNAIGFLPLLGLLLGLCSAICFGPCFATAGYSALASAWLLCFATAGLLLCLVSGFYRCFFYFFLACLSWVSFFLPFSIVGISIPGFNILESFDTAYIYPAYYIVWNLFPHNIICGKFGGSQILGPAFLEFYLLFSFSFFLSSF